MKTQTLAFQFVLFLSMTFNCFGQNIENRITEINCDSIYPNEKVNLKLISFAENEDGYDGEKNSIFEIELTSHNSKKIILRDSIFSSAQIIKFVDFNNDKTKDILVQNISDVRSNWTYNLYLYDKKKHGFEKVKGFEEIKGPKYNAKYNIVESYVVSGKNWIGFYKIIKNKIYDYNLEINNDDFDKEYEKAIKKIQRWKI